MKKRILLLVCLLTAVFVFASCSTTTIDQNINLSELRSDIMTAENQGLKVVAVSGIREEPFAIDGVSQPSKTEFTIITLSSDSLSLIGNYLFTAQIENVEFSGEMVKHPFNQTYSAEIKKECKSGSMTFTVTQGDITHDFTPATIRQTDFIEGNKAYDIAYAKLKGSISGRTDVTYEIFVRLIENPINTSGGYYWYVAFIFSDKTTLAALIDPVTTKIEAIKN